jgi:hypothetical protein
MVTSPIPSTISSSALEGIFAGPLPRRPGRAGAQPGGRLW